VTWELRLPGDVGKKSYRCWKLFEAFRLLFTRWSQPLRIHLDQDRSLQQCRR